MPALITIMDKDAQIISTLELKRLLVDLKQKRPDICFRYRLIGELWAVNMMSIVQITERGVLLNDLGNRMLVAVTDLSNIMQFEIDNSFQGFKPYYHYTVAKSPEF